MQPLAPPLLLPFGKEQLSDSESSSSDHSESSSPPTVNTHEQTNPTSDAKKTVNALDALRDHGEAADFLHRPDASLGAHVEFKPQTLGPNPTQGPRKRWRGGEPVDAEESYALRRKPPVPEPDSAPGVGKSNGDVRKGGIDGKSEVIGFGRTRGSACVENADQRGRRINFGAHASLVADPWSACNPDFQLQGARGKRRPK